MNNIKETNLEEVKQTAISFANMPIKKTEISFLVMHPVFESAFIGIDIDGHYEIKNILENKKYREIAINQIISRIEQSKTVKEVVFIIRKSYRLTFFKHINEYLSEYDYNTSLKKIWIESENPNCDVNCPIHMIQKWFSLSTKDILMEKEEYSYYISLPKEVKVYRGVNNKQTVKGMSWTLNKEKAQWFAHRFHQEGTVYQALIDKENIYCVFLTRGELEVVLDPSKLTDIKETY